MEESNKYKGIKIPEEIIIVEKHNGQGYVVLPGSNLDNALNWAKYTDSKWIDGKWTIIAEYEGVVHTYKNGEFTISLYDSADRSSQGGKLSFWNCTIHAPDGKDFIIGINSDLLFKLMMNSTIVNGDIKEKVWLGKEKNNTGVYFDYMEDFKQARAEDIIPLIRPNTKLVAVMHASNVCGSLLPVKEIGAICRERNIPFILDAAQTAAGAAEVVRPFQILPIVSIQSLFSSDWCEIGVGLFHGLKLIFTGAECCGSDIVSGSGSDEPSLLRRQMPGLLNIGNGGIKQTDEFRQLAFGHDPGGGIPLGQIYKRKRILGIGRALVQFRELDTMLFQILVVVFADQPVGQLDFLIVQFDHGIPPQSHPAHLRSAGYSPERCFCGSVRRR